MSAKKVAYSPSFQPNLVFVKILYIVPKERTTRKNNSKNTPVFINTTIARTSSTEAEVSD